MKKNIEKKSFAKFVIINVVTVILSISLCFAVGANEIEIAIATICVAILVGLWEFRYHFNEHENNQLRVDNVIREFSEYTAIAKNISKVNDIEHPYLKEVTTACVDTVKKQLSEQVDKACSGNCRIGFSDLNCFYRKGIQHTKPKGIIRATFDGFNSDEGWDIKAYLQNYNGSHIRNQKELLKKDKELTIKRLIFFPSEEVMQENHQILDDNYNAGIDVRYLCKDNPPSNIKQKWLNSDYLIQDDALLVQFRSPRRARDEGFDDSGYEDITSDNDEIKKYTEQFDILFKGANTYKPSIPSPPLVEV